jgi:flagellar biosynthesis protein FlhF
MQVKKYLAPTLKLATEQMKDELGYEAIILSTRMVKQDVYPGNKMFELTAGVDEVLVADVPPKPVLHKSEDVYQSFEDELNKISKKIFQNTDEIEKELEPRKPGIKANDFTKNNFTDTSYSNKDFIKNTVKKLEYEEIEKPIIKKIIIQLQKYGKFLQLDNLDAHIHSTIASMIPTREFNIPKSSKPKVVSLVGPTGVGKTTCIAKLAIISKILHNLDVGLISIDTYRLGALDQLKVFSDVSNIDMLVAYEPSDLKRIMQEFEDKDVIFIDTAGRSQKNEESLVQSKKFLTNAYVDETYLVMNATSTTKTLLDIADRFRLFNYENLIFTKIDEGVVFGNLLNLITRINVPTMFLANGQVIPDDIISADADYMAKLIYGRKVN